MADDFSAVAMRFRRDANQIPLNANDFQELLIHFAEILTDYAEMLSDFRRPHSISCIR
ncbi:MAG TPA: hypothetical protein VNB22_11375 [Pyrinomonadaceae bacterium]|nr:hypothetical protein [Pyrinomonadaceae bacterium]